MRWDMKYIGVLDSNLWFMQFMCESKEKALDGLNHSFTFCLPLPVYCMSSRGSEEGLSFYSHGLSDGPYQSLQNVPLRRTWLSQIRRTRQSCSPQVLLTTRRSERSLRQAAFMALDSCDVSNYSEWQSLMWGTNNHSTMNWLIDWLHKPNPWLDDYDHVDSQSKLVHLLPLINYDPDSQIHILHCHVLPEHGILSSRLNTTLPCLQIQMILWAEHSWIVSVGSLSGLTHPPSLPCW